MPNPTLTLRIEIDPALVPDGDIGPLLEALASFTPVLEEIGQVMGAAERQNFASQGATFGAPWEGWADSTAKERFRSGRGPNQLLVRSGKLEEAIGETVSVGQSSVTTGVDLSEFPDPYPAYLNAGDEKTGLPARVLVAFSPQEKDEIQQIVNDFIQQRTGGVSGVTVTMQEV